MYRCAHGVPALFLERRLGANDRRLRDSLYNGFLGSYYGYVMPFLTLPARPFRLSWRDWIVYALALVGLGGLAVHLIGLIAGGTIWGPADALFVVVAIVIAAFLWRHAYLTSLLALAIPVKVSLLLSDFKPNETFARIHRRLVGNFQSAPEKLRVLDVATGNCAALYRHGWMDLNAEYTGVDLSETMLRQGLAFMASKRVAMEFALADATNLPFQSETFDIVLNYGAVNAITDPASALQEMSRVAKKGGLVLFYDEQLYGNASLLEKLYFHRVLSSHNVIDRCPIELLPSDLVNIEVHQVYQFYYICFGTKA